MIDWREYFAIAQRNASQTKENPMTRLIRSSVECPGGTDIEYHPLPAGWDDMTEEQQEAHCVEVAVTQQTNVAPCGADVVDLDDATLARIRRNGLLVE